MLFDPRSRKSLSGKRAMVTGGCGFIGSHLVKSLLNYGAEVWVLTGDGPCARLESILPSSGIIQLDFSKKEEVARVLSSLRPHFIFSAAAKIWRDIDFHLLEPLVKAHVQELYNVVEGARHDAELIRMVHLGTVDEYGKIPAPFRENARENPQNPYALTKLMGTRLIEWAGRSLKLPVVVVRPSLIYGPAQRRGMLITEIIYSCLAKKDFLMTPGEQTRDFLYVDDLVDGILKAAVTSDIDGEIINLGSGKATKLKEAAVLLNQMLGNMIEIKFGAIPYRAGENMEYWLDIAKARRMLDWHPATALAGGLTATIDWYVKNKEFILNDQKRN